MFPYMRYHRRHFRDAGVPTHGKVLEKLTIDAARAIGLEHEIGSLEAGKKADIILVDLFKPDMMPLNMPVYRVTSFAHGADRCTIIVNGKVYTVDEAEVMELAQATIDRMVERTGLQHLLESPKKL